MKKSIVPIIALATLFIGLQYSPPVAEWDDTTSVSSVLIQLGEEKPDHYIPQIDTALARIGEELVFTGRSKTHSGRSTYISKFFICTDCHNTVREDSILTNYDPELRLEYAVNNDIPFLQGTTFWGMVNRETFYNDEYTKKYGDLVEKAKDYLKASIQLCAKQCSSGRYLEDWELEAMVHYFWTLELKMGDLDLSEKEWRKINMLGSSENARKEVLELIKSKYSIASPAHFGELPPDYKKGFEGLQGNPEKGRQIYEKSCLTCHAFNGPSQLFLDESKFTSKKFKKNIKDYNYFNLYVIARNGTYAQPGHMQYMPQYTKERMSDQQLEDLRSFIFNMGK